MNSDVLIDPSMLDFSKTCRLCLQQSTELSALYPETEPTDSTVSSLPSKIMACVSIEVSPDNNTMPKQVCSKCVQQIDNWVKFKELCEDANALLHQCLANFPSSNDETETLKFNLQAPDQTLLFDMDASIFERDSLFGQFEEGSLQLSEDLNLSFSESILNQKIQPCKTMNVENNAKSVNDNLDSNILLSDNVNVESKEEKGRKSDEPSKYKLRYDTIYRKSYPCDVCHKTFTKFTHLLRHDRLEHIELLKDISCEKCGLLFVTQERLNMHMSKHREKTFECNECHKKMISKKSLSAHMTIHVSDKFKCNMCGTVKHSRRMLEDHVRSVHTIEYPFRCELCGKLFKAKQNKDRHYTMHLNQKTTKCNICGCLLADIKRYKTHMLSHNTKRDLVCHICGKTFTSKMLLTNHMHIHMNKKPYKCPICSYSFSKRCLLTRHEATHLDLFPYMCSICDKSFKRKDLLVQHMPSHVKAKHFTCHLCTNAFTSLRNLRRHKCKGYDKVLVNTDKMNNGAVNNCNVVIATNPDLHTDQ